MPGDLLGYRVYRLKREAQRHWLGLLLLVLLAYFAYHSIHGSRSLSAWVDRNHELELKRLELAKLSAQRQWLEERVHALGSATIDVDLLEETLYELGFVYDNEVVILDPATTN